MHTVHGMLTVVAGQVGQGMMTVVVVGIVEFAGTTKVLEFRKVIVVEAGAGVVIGASVVELFDGAVVVSFFEAE